MSLESSSNSAMTTTDPPPSYSISGSSNLDAMPKSPASLCSSSDLQRNSRPAATDIRRATFVSGRAALVSTAAGAQCLDCVSKDVILGHAHPALREALLRQTLSGSVGQLHPTTAELTRKLVGLMPAPLTACFFVNSASEANDLAISMALCASGGDEMVSLDRAYHGRSAVCLRMGRDRGTPFGRAKLFNVVAAPDKFRGKYRDADFPANDIGWMYSSDVKEVCGRLVGEGKKLAGFIAEAVMHQTGHIELPSRDQDYLSFVKVA